MSADTLGISGLALYVPPARVPLVDWCQWTGNDWEKVRAVVGYSFRMPAWNEDAYTMAASAVVQLIRRYDVDPRRIGFLALATESSTDNSAGAVIVKGMVDQALTRLGLPLLPRACEVPEIKQACLAGVYALKSALRYLALDGRGRQAIVVSSDIAAYPRGSSGEPTQGAGAVAQLVTEQPALLEANLDAWAGVSAYRAVDFRKPFKRYLGPAHRLNGTWHDFPVFNGKFSAACYVDEVRHAFDELAARLGIGLPALLARARAVVTHRPFHRMPIDALATIHVVALMRDPQRAEEAADVCGRAGADLEKARAEATSSFDLLSAALAGNVSVTAYPQLTKIAKVLSGSARHREALQGKVSLGLETVKHLGNLYTASLPAWLAAALEEAAEMGQDLAGSEILAAGYGSGNASEAMLLRVAPAWHNAAARLGIAAALERAVDLTQQQYEALHAGERLDLPPPEESFFIDRVGTGETPELDDVGIDYYRYRTAL